MPVDDLSVVSTYDRAYATRRGTLADLDRRLARWSALFRHRHQLADPEVWVEVIEGEDSLSASRALLWPDGQRRPADRAPTAAERARVRDEVVANYRVGDSMAGSLRRTVEAVQRQGIDVVLVWLPVPDRLVRLLPDSRLLDEARQFAGELADELSIELIDVSAGFTDVDFVDYTHLGHRAAQRLSQQLAAHLRAFASPVS